MRNFAGKNRPEKKVWGVLGKQETFYSPEQFQDKGRIIPLNANPLEAWDSTRSRYIRRPQMPPLANDGQQAGVVPQETPSPDVTPTPTGTPSVTPSPTPSVTPPAFLTPDLWYDATNIGSIDYISSGGTDYVAAWRSIGTYQKVLTGTTTDTMPVWSGSSLFPSSPLVVRFNKSATAGLRDFLTQRFDSTVVPVSGSSVFMVVGNPGYNYSASSVNTNGFGVNLVLYSGNTTTGGFIPTPSSFPVLYGTAFNSGTNNSISLTFASSGYSVIGNGILGFSASNLNNKFLYTQVVPYPSGLPSFGLNNSTTGTTTNITGTTASNINAISIGTVPTSGGTLSTTINAGAEIAEIMVFGRPLTAGEQTQVQNYLKAKWRYDEWSVIPPSPTPTSTSTPTPSVTQTQTTTPTPSVTATLTPSPTPSGAQFCKRYTGLVTAGGNGQTWNYTQCNNIGGTLRLLSSNSGTMTIYSRSGAPTKSLGTGTITWTDQGFEEPCSGSTSYSFSTSSGIGHGLTVTDCGGNTYTTSIIPGGDYSGCITSYTCTSNCVFLNVTNNGSCTT